VLKGLCRASTNSIGEQRSDVYQLVVRSGCGCASKKERERERERDSRGAFLSKLQRIVANRLCARFHGHGLVVCEAVILSLDARLLNATSNGHFNIMMGPRRSPISLSMSLTSSQHLVSALHKLFQDPLLVHDIMNAFSHSGITLYHCLQYSECGSWSIQGYRDGPFKRTISLEKAKQAHKIRLFFCVALKWARCISKSD
jgi:hypothetical protein